MDRHGGTVRRVECGDRLTSKTALGTYRMCLSRLWRYNSLINYYYVHNLQHIPIFQLVKK